MGGSNGGFGLKVMFNPAEGKQFFIFFVWFAK